MANVNCCKDPKMENLKVLSESSHDSENILRCTACGAHWFSCWEEMVNYSGGDDSSCSYYARITEEEAQIIVAADGRPDLSFLGLGKRPALRIDERGACEVDGMPR